MLSKMWLLRFAVTIVVLMPSLLKAESAPRCNPTSNAIDVHVHGVRSNSGYVTFVLYGDNPNDFLVKGRKLLKERFPAQNGTVEFCLPVPHPGIYAAAAYHDENGNKKFDKNWIGLPTEGFGVSNCPEIYLVPPSHDEAAFEVQNALTRVDIQLSY